MFDSVYTFLAKNNSSTQELEPDMKVLYHPHGDHLRSSVVWLMYPMHSDCLKLESIRELLQYFNRVRFFILTSEVKTVRQSSSKIYVPSTFGNGSSFIAELRHISALWQLRRKQVECSWFCSSGDTESAAVRFCAPDDVKANEVVSFYTAANELWREGIKTFHVAILSVSDACSLSF